MKTFSSTIALILIATVSFAQTAENLKERIQDHYKAIHAADGPSVISHHLKEFTLFPYNGNALWESGWEKTFEKMGASYKFPNLNATMKHFSAQIYNNVGVATFYLDGTYDDISSLTRVTAVWVWKDGVWKEAHHHESELKY